MKNLNSINIVNKHNVSIYFLFVLLISVLLISCNRKPKTIEQQVEQLMKTSESEWDKRKQIAYSLADSLNPRAVELILGLPYDYQNTTLNDMLFRYSEIVKKGNISNREIAYECINLMSTKEGASYLGRQSVTEGGNAAFNLIKEMDKYSKKTAIIAGLENENGLKNMQDSLLLELHKIGWDEIERMFIDNEISNNALQKIITSIIQSKNISDSLKTQSIMYGLKTPELKNENGLTNFQDSLLLELYKLGEDNISELLYHKEMISINALKKIITYNIQSKNISTDLKKQSILCGLKTIENDENFQSFLINSAKKFGNNMMIKLINDWYIDQSEGLFKAIISFGNNAIPYLIKQLGENETKKVEDLLAHIGQPAVNSLMVKMKHKDQNVRFAAADALVKMSKYHPNAVRNLTNAFDNQSNQSISIIAKNYPFYIRMGLSGTEGLLIKALDNYFSYGMCIDYLNCGNGQIEEGAKIIANKNGYHVFKSPGSHYGPRWGGGN